MPGLQQPERPWGAAQPIGFVTDDHFRRIAAHLPNTVVFLVDTDLRFVVVEGAGLIAAGFDPRAMEGRLLADVLPAELMPDVLPHYLAALAGDTVEFDAVSEIAGTVHRTRAMPFRDGDGTIVGALLISEDVTAERASQTVLAETRSFLDAVLTASPDVTLVQDAATGAVTWSSRDLALVLGWPAGGPRGGGTSFADLVSTEDAADLQDTVATVVWLRDGETVTSRFRMRAPTGHRWMSQQSTPFGRDAAGAVISVLSVLRDVTELVEVEHLMEHAALHDPLTGLPNRTLLLDRLTTALARAERSGTDVVVLFCDLDGFKRVNDTDGHAAGDAVLVEVADRLRHVLRQGDSVARVGGDEFVLVLESRAEASIDGSGPPAPDPRAVELALAERIRTELQRPVVHEGREHVVSVSLGMTVARRGTSADAVLRDADTAMYRAKQRGKDRVEVFDEALRADLAARSDVERVLRRALGSMDGGTGRFSVEFQPVYELTSRRLVGFEALARLVDHRGRPIPPQLFIPTAEENGLISVLGLRVLDDALANLARWNAAHLGSPRATMAVNLSARQAQHSDMPRAIRAALDRHAVDPGDLVLELTESVLLESGSSTLRQLTELRAAGIGIAIDDFGTGYASLRYLATLPVSAVKVDQSFTAAMRTDRVSATIVRAIATLARDLGLACVVEGIESPEQLAELPAGVLGQGFLFGRPTPTPQHSWGATTV